MTENRSQKPGREGQKKNLSSFLTSRIFDACLLIPVFCLLTACGFQPLYGTHTTTGETAEVLNQVAIDNIPDRNGQILRNYLIDRMYGKGRPKKPLYHLTIKITSSVADIGIQANATSTRSLVDLSATYVLMDAFGKQLLTGTAHSITNFNKLSDQYGSEIALEDAYDRTLHEAAEQIVNRVSLYLSEPQVQSPEQIAPQAPIPPGNSNGLPTTQQGILPLAPFNN